jgi:pimeloyl-ACP methyl ester carboxylesterase
MADVLPSGRSIESSPAAYRSGSGTPLLLLHGFTGSWRLWLPLLPALSTTFDVFAPTLPGHHGGPPIELARPFTLDQLTDRVERELDARDIDRPHVVGSSMGGGLAIQLAARGRVASCIGVAPGFDWPADDPTRQQVADSLRRQHTRTRNSRWITPLVMRSNRLRRQVLAHSMNRGDLVPAREAVRMARAAADCTIADAIIDGIAGGSALLDHLDRIAMPTLIAWPEDDHVAPRTGRSRFETEIPGVTVRTLPGVGHLPMYDDTDLLVNTITQWVLTQEVSR